MMRWPRGLFRAGGLVLLTGVAWASDLDTMGVTQLRTLVPSLVGTDVRVAQPEAGNPAWQVNPAAVAQPLSLFTWISSAGNTNTFPNLLGQQSQHAGWVGGFLYGAAAGVAPGVVHVDNYEAGYFVNTVVATRTAIMASIVNQSFILNGQVPATDLSYDNYAAARGTLFVSGVGNGGPPNSPATAFNGIGVGSSTGTTSVGPTSDARCKPDLTAPGDSASFATAEVSGCAALLAQAGARGDGGAGTAADSTDTRTLKALLLNGATKPAGWTNSSTQPLHFLYGAGVVNVLNSYRQLRGGEQPFVLATTMALDGAHLPPVTSTNLPARRGWDLNTISSSATKDAVHHFFFDLRSDSGRVFTLTATVTWHRDLNQTSLNNLDLFLFDAVKGSQLAASQSGVDNVEHLYLTNLPAGRFDLQVLKHGGSALQKDEVYALAFDFGPPAPVRLADPAWAGVEFRGRLVGEPYTTYVVSGTSDFFTWTPVTTNATGSAGSFAFTNAPAGNPRFLFYGADWLP
jgi:hypothetical protein